MAAAREAIQHDDLLVGVVGPGSNLVVADAGVRGLVVKLDNELSRIELEGTCIRCCGGGRVREDHDRTVA